MRNGEIDLNKRFSIPAGIDIKEAGSSDGIILYCGSMIQADVDEIITAQELKLMKSNGKGNYVFVNYNLLFIVFVNSIPNSRKRRLYIKDYNSKFLFDRMLKIESIPRQDQLAANGSIQILEKCQECGNLFEGNGSESLCGSCQQKELDEVEEDY